VKPVNEAPGVKTRVEEHLRIARVLDAHGDAIGAILAYREVIRDGVEPHAQDARQRVEALARGALPARCS
jgi:hypothetical protein